MRPHDIAELTLLAALWGGSFAFMRVAAPEFGPFALIELRVGVAALALLPFLAWRGRLRDLLTHWKPVLVVGVVNSALPFCLFAYASLSITGGLAAILNSSSPLWTAVVARLWLGEKMPAWRIAGLVIGFAGVGMLVGDTVGVRGDAVAPAVAAALLAALFYGVAGNYAKLRLAGVDPMAVATGTQAAAALVLLPPALWWWPRSPVSGTAWSAVLVMALASTAFAFVLYFRLIARVGPARAITVTFLVPLFGVLWGALFLAEVPTPGMLAGCAVILAGTALSTGIVAPRKGRG
jgi:drug/metabolite transporter (DMT)-like permease